MRAGTSEVALRSLPVLLIGTEAANTKEVAEVP